MLVQRILTLAPCKQAQIWLEEQRVCADEDELLAACPKASWVVWYYRQFFMPSHYMLWDLLDDATQTLYLRTCYDAEHGPDSNPRRLAALHDLRLWHEAEGEQQIVLARTDYLLCQAVRELRHESQHFGAGYGDFCEEFAARRLDVLPGGADAMRCAFLNAREV